MSYSKHTWVTGETVTADLLNHIEDGISEASTPIATSREFNFLVIGNSLSINAYQALPYAIDQMFPNLDYKICIWYNAGIKLTDIYTRFVNHSKADVCKCFDSKSNPRQWVNNNNTMTIEDAVAFFTTIDVVSIQEYSHYSPTDATISTAFDNVLRYVQNIYPHPFKTVCLIDQPERSGYNVTTAMLDRAIHFNKYFFKYKQVEAINNSGSAIAAACGDTLLQSLGDRGGLSPDGTHAQMGLPILMLAYVFALSMAEWLGICASPGNCQGILNTAVQEQYGMSGNVGSGAVAGTVDQNRRAQQIAIQAYKDSKRLEMEALSGNLT